MTHRLETQRPPVKEHARANSRWEARGYDDLKHPVWGEPGTVESPEPPEVVAATTATAGIPGTWGPPGCTVPANQVAVMNGSITAVPDTAWTTGQHMQTQTAGAAGRVCWTGSAWVGGAAP
jgi:hypothetical protein